MASQRVSLAEKRALERAVSEIYNDVRQAAEVHRYTSTLLHFVYTCIYVYMYIHVFACIHDIVYIHVHVIHVYMRISIRNLSCAVGRRGSTSSDG